MLLVTEALGHQRKQKKTALFVSTEQLLIGMNLGRQTKDWAMKRYVRFST